MECLLPFKPLIPLLALLVGAVAAVLVASYARRGNLLEQGAAAVGLIAAFVLGWQAWPSMPGGVVVTFAVDRLSMAGMMIVAASAAFVALLTPSYLAARHEERAGFGALTALAIFGMGALCSAADLISILIALETVSLSLYALVAYLRERPTSLEAALKYFVMGAMATAFFCMGLAFLFGSLGTTDLALIAERAPSVAAGEGRHLFLVGCALLVVAFGFKVAAVPFHAWAPDAYDGAPTPVSLFLATGAKVAAFIAFLRVALAVGGAGGAPWHLLLWGLAAATILWGNVAALRQENVKRLLAYSSIAHAGYLLVAFPSIAKAPAEFTAAVLLYVVALVLSTAGAFAAVTMIGLDPREPVEIRHLAGLARRRPWLAAAFTLFLLSLAGIPPTIGFFAKYDLFLAAARAGDVSLVVVALAGTAISIYYYLRPVVAMVLLEERGEPASEEALPPHAFQAAVVAVLAIAALAVLLLGILPQDLLAFTIASAR